MAIYLIGVIGVPVMQSVGLENRFEQGHVIHQLHCVVEVIAQILDFWLDLKIVQPLLNVQVSTSLFGPTIVRSYEFSAVRPSVLPSVRPSVRPSVLPFGFFSELHHRIFLIFCMKLKVNKG